MSFFPDWNALRERWSQLTTESAAAAAVDGAVRKTAETILKTKAAAAETLHQCTEALRLVGFLAEEAVEEEGNLNDGVRNEGETPESKKES